MKKLRELVVALRTVRDHVALVGSPGGGLAAAPPAGDAPGDSSPVAAELSSSQQPSAGAEPSSTEQAGAADPSGAGESTLEAADGWVGPGCSACGTGDGRLWLCFPWSAKPVGS